MRKKKGAIFILFLMLIITRSEDNKISLIGKDNSFTSDNGMFLARFKAISSSFLIKKLMLAV